MTHESNKTISKISVDSSNDVDDRRWPTHNPVSEDQALDYFAVRNGVEFAGTHIIIDLWDAQPLDDLELMERTLRSAVDISGATLLHIHLHHFTPNGGISGVAVLAESHISVHTWPERGFAAFDVFMCGDAEPEKTIPVLREAFSPSSINISEHLRGVTIDPASPNK
jgi:S-adenosylmethionine decarboxylase